MEREKNEGAVVLPGLEGQESAAVADTVAVGARAHVGDDGMAVLKEMLKKLMAENLALQEELIAEKTAHACVLLDNVRLQQNKQMVVDEKKENYATVDC